MAIIPAIFDALGFGGGGGGGGGDNWWTASAAATHGSVVGTQTNIWQAILSALVGTYGLIRQYQQLERQVDLAERGVDQAEAYLNIASDAYVNISVPTVVRNNTMFDVYATSFQIYEAIYLADAFRFGDYYPEYAAQEGRTLGMVQAQFDRAARQRKRAAGKYNTGRVAWDSQWFVTMAALAKIDAVNHGYRYEDSKKITLDGWYWERRSSGARMNEAHAVRVTNGLQGGATVAQGGLAEMGRGVGAVQYAINQASEAYAQKGNFWGSTVGAGGFQAAGMAYGGAPPFGRQVGGGVSGPNNPIGATLRGMLEGFSTGLMTPMASSLLTRGDETKKASNDGSNGGIGSNHGLW